MKTSMLLHLSLSTLLVENGRNNVLICLPNLAKKDVIENCDLSKFTKYLIFPICFFVKGRHFTIFYKFDKFEIDF